MAVDFRSKGRGSIRGEGESAGRNSRETMAAPRPEKTEPRRSSSGQRSRAPNSNPRAWEDRGRQGELT